MRANAVVVFVGKPRTGKTVELLKSIDRDKKKVLIYDLNNEPKYRKFPKMPLDKLPTWKAGKYRVFTHDAAGLLKDIADNVRNATVVLEDATSYLNSNTNAILQKLLVSRRHWNLDIFLTFHSLNRVPPLVYEMSNFIVIKKTQDSSRKLYKMDKIPNPDALIEAWKRVNASPNEFEQITIQTNA